MKKVSIVIPAKNEEKGLKILLPKIIKQHFHEVIVVNDGSMGQQT